MMTWHSILIAQVIKRYEHNRVVGVTRQIYQGTKEAITEVIKLTQVRVSSTRLLSSG